MNLKIMLTDDHVLFRKGLAQLLMGHALNAALDENIEIVEETGNGIECMKKLRLIRPHILLLDINMPKMSGLDVLKKIEIGDKNTKILMLTGSDKEEDLIQAMKDGANGYLKKDSEPEELKDAIQNVMTGGSYVQKKLRPILEHDMEDVRKNGDSKEFLLLTKREREILNCLVKGMMNKEIAACYRISEQTVKNHVSSLLNKLNLSDRTQAAVFGVKCGLSN